MNSLVAILFDICRRRSGPQDLPYSTALLRGLVIAATGVEILLSLVVREHFDSPARLVFSLVLALGLPWLLLHWRGHGERTVQTLCALVGVGLVFALLLAPLAWLARDVPLPSEAVPPTPSQVFVSVLALMLVGWKLMTDAHIWRHALDWPFAGGVLVALGMLFLEIGLVQMLFSPGGSPAG